MSSAVVIRYVDGTPETRVCIDLSDGAGAVRNAIRSARPELKQRRLKLLSNGRVVTRETDFSTRTKLNKDSVVFFDCIVGEELSKAQLQDEERLDQQPKKTTSEAQRGFDRLLSQGFSTAEVNDLRRQFMALHGSELGDNESLDEEGYTHPTATNIRELEEQWMDSTTNTGMGPPRSSNDAAETNNEAPGSNVRNSEWELVIGVIAGFCLGGLALLLLYLEVGGVFNKKTQMSILCGVFINISFSLLRLWS